MSGIVEKRVGRPGPNAIYVGVSFESAEKTFGVNLDRRKSYIIVDDVLQIMRVKNGQRWIVNPNWQVRSLIPSRLHVEERAVLLENYLIALAGLRRERYVVYAEPMKRVVFLSDIIADIPPEFTRVAFLDNYGATQALVTVARDTIKQIGRALREVTTKDVKT